MTDRRRLLARLERLRAVERHDALALLAARQAEQHRMEQVARRSRDLAGTGLLANPPVAGAALSASLAFHARLAALASRAAQLGAEAGAAQAAARAQFAAADLRLERVRERRGQADDEADRRKLAQSLLNSLHQPRGPK